MSVIQITISYMAASTFLSDGDYGRGEEGCPGARVSRELPRGELREAGDGGVGGQITEPQLGPPQSWNTSQACNLVKGGTAPQRNLAAFDVLMTEAARLGEGGLL